MSAVSHQHVLTRVRRFYPAVATVVDATGPLRIRVTAADLKGAKKKAPNECAMARACERQCKLDGAIIRPRVAYLIRGVRATRYMVPESVTREIVSFDRHEDFRPGEYQLLRVQKHQRMGYRTRPTSRSRRTRQPRQAPLVIHRTTGLR